MECTGTEEVDEPGRKEILLEKFGIRFWFSCSCRSGLMATRMGGLVLKLKASYLAFLKHSLWGEK